MQMTGTIGSIIGSVWSLLDCAPKEKRICNKPLGYRNQDTETICQNLWFQSCRQELWAAVSWAAKESSLALGLGGKNKKNKWSDLPATWCSCQEVFWWMGDGRPQKKIFFLVELTAWNVQSIFQRRGQKKHSHCILILINSMKTAFES